MYANHAISIAHSAQISKKLRAHHVTIPLHSDVYLRTRSVFVKKVILLFFLNSFFIKLFLCFYKVISKIHPKFVVNAIILVYYAIISVNLLVHNALIQLSIELIIIKFVLVETDI